MVEYLYVTYKKKTIGFSTAFYATTAKIYPVLLFISVILINITLPHN